MPIRVPKSLVRRKNRKSLILLDGRRFKFKILIPDCSYWLLLT